MKLCEQLALKWMIAELAGVDAGYRVLASLRATQRFELMAVAGSVRLLHFIALFLETHCDVKWRTRVVSIFPNYGTCLRLISTVLMEICEEWQADEHIYLAIETSGSLLLPKS